MIDDHEKEVTPSCWSIRGDSAWVVQEFIRFCDEGSTIAKQTVQCELDVVYGESANERIDIFFPQNTIKDAPVFVYIHGGYWQEMSRGLSSFVAPCLTKAKAVVAVIGYDLAPSVDLETMISQCTKGIIQVLKMAKDRDSRGVYFLGHSAGAHLLAMATTGNWEEMYGENAKLLKGFVFLSGAMDVRPIINTTVNNAMKLTREEAWKYSPIRLADETSIMYAIHDCHVIVAYAEHEPKTFHDMSVNYEQALKKNGVKTQLLYLPGYDHFDSMQELTNPDNILTKEVLKMMQLHAK